jgi:hypothetical protein
MDCEVTRDILYYFKNKTLGKSTICSSTSYDPFDFPGEIG